MLKNYYKLLPKDLRNYLTPKIVKFINLISAIFAVQRFGDPIGRVRIPYLAKNYLKKSVAQQGEDLILDRIITRILRRDINTKGIFVDVGAYHPVDHSVTYLLYLRGWHGIVFDPSVVTRNLFRKLRPSDTFVKAVVGEDDNEEVDFYIHNGADKDQSLVSSKYPNNKNDFRKIVHHQVNLNKELKRQKIAKIDVLNIDVEGAELEIIQNFEFEYFSPTIIAIEIHGNNIIACLETEEAKLILGKGYRLVGCTVITYFFVREEEIADLVS